MRVVEPTQHHANRFDDITMSDTNSSRTSRTMGSAAPAAERRTRLRLRELCDEVLASYRVATGRELFTDADRQAAAKLIAVR